MFKKILVASDGSEHAIRAAEKAATLAKLEKDAIIEIVYVVDDATSKSDVLRNWEAVDIESKRKALLNTTEEICRKAGVSFETKIIHGEPGPAIVKHANENHVDLVVIGSRGLNSLQEMVLGSVSHKVAKRANCPVMIIK